MVKNYTVTVNGTAYSVQVAEGDGVSAPVQSAVAAPVAAPVAATPVATAPVGGQGSVKIEAPMPGLIVATKVSVGDTVKKGQAVVVLEAMKMENDVTAASDGTVASVNVKKGDNVESGTVLVTLN
jgi:biotin carboxyl carrier protein